MVDFFPKSVCLDAQVRSTFSRFFGLRHIWKDHPFYVKWIFFKREVNNEAQKKT